MATNAPLGTSCNPGFFDRGTLALTLNRAPGPLCASRPTSTEIEHAVRKMAQRLHAARGWLETRSAIGDLLGPQCFTAGVVAGIGSATVGAVVELAELIKTLALAEYDDAKHRSSFGHALTALMPFGLLGLAAAESMFMVDRFWEGFDKYAKEAHEERDALFQLVTYAFEHPGKVFGSIGSAQVARYEGFKKDLNRHTMAGNFEAGMLAGELLLEVLLIIDGVTAIAKPGAPCQAW